MLKSPMPVYLCSTAFSIVFLSATDRRPLVVETPADNILYTVRETSIAAVGNTTRSIVSAPNKKEMKFVRSYIRRNDQCLFNVKKRSEVPFTIIDSVFNHYGLPHELKYLAVIESELKPAALSRVGAKGPWQLMPATASIFGLKMNSHGDERMNYYKSTRAAARYLRDLYHQFGDWLLVLAAYNGGPGPVFHAIHKSHNRNFWALQQWLPAESREHVKKFIATDYYFNQSAANPHLPKAQAVVQPIPAENQPKHLQESADDKFSRLMRESANSLQKSNELLGK
jgi:membrane-bound lytic murein transglycosylase MltF